MSFKSTLEAVPQGVKLVGDGTSVSVLVATLMNGLPVVAAVLTIMWTGIRIYETDTVQKLLRKKK